MIQLMFRGVVSFPDLAEVVWELLGAGADPNAVALRGWTPLLAAAVGGHADVVRQLLGAGADVTASTCRGWNALHMSAQSGYAGE